MAQPVQSLSGFMDEVRKVREKWHVAGHIDLWFRGEGQKHETSILRPALYRPPRGENAAMKEVGELLKIESQLYEEFIRVGKQLLTEKPELEDEDWDWYFLMRHHDAPTRLLDWSDGALVALHFALRDRTKDNIRANKEGQRPEPRVYVLGPDRLKDALDHVTENYRHEKENWKRYIENHPYYLHGEDSGDAWEVAYIPADEDERKELPVPRWPLVMEFPHITRRIAAQRSRFVVFGTDPFWLAEEYEKRGFMDVIEIDPDPENIIKTRCELRDAGITESVIFPDLDGLGREIKQIWEDRK